MKRKYSVIVFPDWCDGSLTGAVRAPFIMYRLRGPCSE